MSEIHNPVFDIVPNPQPGAPYASRVKFKGKEYPDSLMSFYGGEAYILLPPKIFLDFDAIHLPKGFNIMMCFYKERRIDFLEHLHLSRKQKFITMTFIFGIEQKHFSKMDVNPFKILQQFVNAAKEIGYTTSLDMQEEITHLSFEVKVKVPPQGNLYHHYVKHVAIFNDLLRQAQREVLVRIKNG